jgi:hypothetical protein
MAESTCDSTQTVVWKSNGEFISGLALAQYAGMMGPADGERREMSRIDRSRESLSFVARFRSSTCCAEVIGRVSGRG